MSRPSPNSSEADSPPEEPAPLTHQTRDGRPYVRRPEVRNEIRRVVGADPVTWDVPYLQSETLVHLIRQFRSRAQTMSAYTTLVDQLGGIRTGNVAELRAGGIGRLGKEL